MNRKERRKLRKMRSREARENYHRNRQHWLERGRPLAVMDDPTEEHVNALLKQLSVREVLINVQSELSRRQRRDVSLAQVTRMFFRDSEDTLQLCAPTNLSAEMREHWGQLMTRLLEGRL